MPNYLSVMWIAVNCDSCHVVLCSIKSLYSVTQRKQHEWRECDTAQPFFFSPPPPFFFKELFTFNQIAAVNSDNNCLTQIFN